MRTQRLTSLIALLLLTTGVAMAQTTNTIDYGSTVAGTITEAGGVLRFQFEGGAGDQVSIRAISITPGFDIALVLLAPNGQSVMAVNDNDLFTPGSTDPYLSARLPADGVYPLEVQSINDVPGNFLIRLSARRPAAGSVRIPADQPLRIDLPPGSFPVSYEFLAQATAPTTLAVSGEPPLFPYVVEIRDQAGMLVAMLNGAPLDTAQVTVPAGANTYNVIVSPSNPERGGSVVLALNDAFDAPLPEAVEPVDMGVICAIVSDIGLGVNIRSGPGTNYPPLATLSATDVGEVIGRNNDNTWFNLQVDERVGWVAASVTRLEGFCENVPFVQAPPPPPPTAAPPAENPEASGAGEGAPPAEGEATGEGEASNVESESTPLPDDLGGRVINGISE